MRKEKKAKSWCFSRFNLLKVLSPEEKKLLESKVFLKSYRAGDIILLRDDQERNIYFLKDGKAMLYRYCQQNNKFLVEIVQPGELFGELVWMQNKEYDFAQVLSDALLCYLNVKKWEEYVGIHSNLNTNLMKWMGIKISNIEYNLETLLLDSSKPE